MSGDQFPGAACVDLDNDATQETEGGVLTPMEVHHGPDVECLSLEASKVVDALFEAPRRSALFRAPRRMTEAEEEWAFGDGPTPPLINDDDDDLPGEDAVVDRGIFDVPVSVVTPRVECPLCSCLCIVSVGLVRHISAKHEGATLDIAACSCLSGFGKALCSSCGALRAANGNFCGRCRTSVGTRPPVAGDVVRAPKSERESIPVESTSDGPSTWVPNVPENLVERLQRIPCNTIVHVPVAFRDRLSRILTRCNTSMVTSDAEGNLCARAWPKLLFSVPPGGFNLQNELSKRFALWRDGDLLQLLCRVEEQCRLKSQSKILKRSIKSQGAARRARIFIQEGVLSKAAKALTGDVAILSEDEQIIWARKLLPSSDNSAGALLASM